jgi:hypothetical protein
MEIELRKFLSLVSPYDVRDYGIACASKDEFPKEFALTPTSIKD